MKKVKDYTISVDVHVTKDDEDNAKRWYSLTIHGHPLTENNEPVEFALSNWRESQVTKVGNALLEAIWNVVAEKDKSFWEK